MTKLSEGFFERTAAVVVMAYLVFSVIRLEQEVMELESQKCSQEKIYE